MLVKRCKIINKNGTEEIKDILIENGFISRIEKDIHLANISETDIVDAEENYVLPGIVDVHTHMRDPGLTHKEDFTTGSQACARGGVTTFIDMPNTVPNTTTYELLIEKKNKMKENAYVDYGFHFGGKKTDNSDEVSKITQICASTKIFLNVSTGDMLVEDIGILERIFKNSKIVAVHAEGEMVERAINLSEKLDIPLYLCHLSTEDELEMLKNAKNKGLKVFGEVTPHHLFLNRENMEETDDTRLLLRMKPELKEKKDNNALWNAINSGLINSLGTDHAPHTLEEKMTKLTFGIPSVEHSLEMMLSAVKNKKITMLKLIEIMCKNPAEIFKIKNKGDIKIGNHGDLVIVDINDNSPIKNDKIVSKSGWTPYSSFNRGGRVLTTILRGNIVYSKGEFFGKYGKEITYFD